MKAVAGPTSMPSYHFTQFFAVGASLSEAYCSYWPYLITAAGLTADMFAGAAIGVLIGYSTAHNLKIKLGLAEKSKLMIEPDVRNKSLRLSYQRVFD